MVIYILYLTFLSFIYIGRYLKEYAMFDQRIFILAFDDLPIYSIQLFRYWEEHCKLLP